MKKSVELPREKREYELGKRLANMEQTRRSVLQAARQQLESRGYQYMTMASLALESGVTRQTIHNLYGSKQGVLESLFDSIALEGGMERMRDVMHQQDPTAMLKAFVSVFCEFWKGHLVLFRRIHGIGAIDPELGRLIQARNDRRLGAAGRIVKLAKVGRRADDATATIAALTSFEFYDALIHAGRSPRGVEKIVLAQALAALVISA
jgi:AcrR family transcriptional regulator